MTKSLAFIGALLLLIGSIVSIYNSTNSSSNSSSNSSRRILSNTSTSRQLRQLAKSIPYSAFQNTRSMPTSAGSTLQLPPIATEWCMAPSLPVMDYIQCDPNVPVNRIPVDGGLTNAFKFILLGAIDSFEEGRCFFLDESESKLFVKSSSDTTTKHSLLTRYFEPIGLDPNSIVVQKALLENRVETRDWVKVFRPTEKRRISGSSHSIPSLFNEAMEGHLLKTMSLKRMWRPLSLVRNSACMALEQQGLNDDYMAFSVRRGDKHTVEHFIYPTADAYITAATRAIETRFGGVIPKIFVATDDCAVMREFRTLQPTWNFVGECDLVKNSADHGFALTDMKEWSEEYTDQHYEKFMAELFGLAIAKHVIGVTYTNVSWWVLFMRGSLEGLEFVDDHNLADLSNW